MMVAAFVSLAIATWGAPACGTPVVDPGAHLPPSYVGLADTTRCRAFFDHDVWRILTPAERCSAIVHELGHLAGQQHSPDPRSIMYPEMHTYRPCVRLVARLRK